MESVRRLTPQELVRQDVEAIAGIYRNLGAQVAEQLVTRVLGELALTMAGLAAQVRRQELRGLSRQLNHLRRMADDIGLISLGQVARDALACLDSGDYTAFSAVWARLLRVAEASLTHDPGMVDSSV